MFESVSTQNLINIDNTGYTLNMTWIIFKEFTPILCQITGVILAGFSIHTWRKQLKSSARYDIAKRMLHTINESSLIVQQINKEINFSFYFEPNKNNFMNYLNESNIKKLQSIQFEMDILEGEACAILDSDNSWYKNLSIFISKYIEAVRNFSIIIKNFPDIDAIKTHGRSVLQDYVPLIPIESCSTLKFFQNQPSHHCSHTWLIDSAKSCIAPYLRHML